MLTFTRVHQFNEPEKTDIWSPTGIIKVVSKPEPSNLLLQLLDRMNHGN